MTNRNQRGLSEVNEVSEARLWKTLDLISERLRGIESQLTEVVRLEERVNSHEQALSRYGNRLDSHDSRIRESELWQANHGDKASVERLVSNVQSEVTNIKKKIELLESNNNVNRGQKDVTVKIVAWIGGILAAIIIYSVNKG
jgi:DNA repair exonuclease SbcCD ATPase subunit